MTRPRPCWLTAAEEALAQLHGRALAAETEDHLAGRAWVTVWHGDLESEQDARLVADLADRAEEYARRWPGCVVLRQGGNDYSSVLFGPAGVDAPAAAELAAQWAAYAEQIAPVSPACRTWWKVVLAAPTAGPP